MSTLIAFAIALLWGVVGAQDHDSASGYDHADPRYGIVVDAGSSGSRLHVYHWPTPQSYEPNAVAPLANPSEILEPGQEACKVKPGIGTSAGLANLQPLIACALARAPLANLTTQQLREIPVFLGATAGLRIVGRHQAAESIAGALSIFQQQPWFNPDKAVFKVLSGEEEATFGWMMVQALNGLLDYTDSTTPFADPEHPRGFGSLDLGGASTQIAFEPANVNILANQWSVRLGPARAHSIYSYSHLYMGQNEMTRRVNRLVTLFGSGGVGQRQHPCLLQGYQTQSEVFSGANGLPLSVNFTGSGSYDGCEQVMMVLMDKKAFCPYDPVIDTSADVPATTPPVSAAGATSYPSGPIPINPTVTAANSSRNCGVGSVYQPQLVSGPPHPSHANHSAHPTNDTLYAYSSFSYIWEFYGLPYNGSSLADLQTATKAFCALTWAEAQAKYPNTPGFLLPNYCLWGTYQYTLLSTGYGIDVQDRSTIRVAPSPSNLPMDAPEWSWALGAMIYQANQEPAQFLEQPTSAKSWIIALGVVSGLLLIFSIGVGVAFARSQGLCLCGAPAAEPTSPAEGLLEVSAPGASVLNPLDTRPSISS